MPRPTAPSSPSTLAPAPAPTRMPIPFRRALNYFRASLLYCIARWRMAVTPFCTASKFITAAAAEIETLPSIVCVRVCVQMYCLCVCVLTNSHCAQNGNDYISYKSSAIRVPPPRPHALAPTSARRVPTVNTLARFDGCICFKITALSIDSHVVANFRMLSVCVCVF